MFFIMRKERENIMTRRDTILIAVIVNAGLLAILFITAVIYDHDPILEPVDNALVIDQQPLLIDEVSSITHVSPKDEVDTLLSYYTPPTSPLSYNNVFSDEESYHSALIDDKATQKPISSDEYVEIVVKKGDILDKIARANGTTVQAIKQLNGLSSEKLSIGQVLKMPLKNENSVKAVKKQIEKSDLESDAVYYVVKSGDSPWKIAKQFNVKPEDILQLNHLDEEKARNLKIGDRIRIK
jgi:peptidoglycan endopeptidase LytF